MNRRMGVWIGMAGFVPFKNDQTSAHPLYPRPGFKGFATLVASGNDVAMVTEESVFPHRWSWPIAKHVSSIWRNALVLYDVLRPTCSIYIYSHNVYS